MGSNGEVRGGHGDSGEISCDRTAEQSLAGQERSWAMSGMSRSTEFCCIERGGEPAWLPNAPQHRLPLQAWFLAGGGCLARASLWGMDFGESLAPGHLPGLPMAVRS